MCCRRGVPPDAVRIPEATAWNQSSGTRGVGRIFRAWHSRLLQLGWIPTGVPDLVPYFHLIISSGVITVQYLVALCLYFLNLSDWMQHLLSN